MIQLAVFDELGALRQFKTGAFPAYREQAITPEQFAVILTAGVTIYDGSGTPNYVYDVNYTAGIPLADGYLREMTAQEKQAWRMQVIQTGGHPAIYADVRVTDGSDSEVPRLRNNGTDTVAVTAKLRWTDNTDDDSNVITLIDGVSWNIQIREATETTHDVITPHPTDPIYDVFEATFHAGVCAFEYFTTHKPAIVYMREADFAILTFPDGQGGTQDYRVALIHPVVVKVYRVLSST